MFRSGGRALRLRPAASACTPQWRWRRQPRRRAQAASTRPGGAGRAPPAPNKAVRSPGSSLMLSAGQSRSSLQNMQRPSAGRRESRTPPPKGSGKPGPLKFSGGQPNNARTPQDISRGGYGGRRSCLYGRPCHSVCRTWMCVSSVWHGQNAAPPPVSRQGGGGGGQMMRMRTRC